MTLSPSSQLKPSPLLGCGLEAGPMSLEALTPIKTSHPWKIP
jgi:hypothetical protein